MQSCTAEDNIAGSMVATHSSGQWLLLLLALMLVASTLKPCSDPGRGTHTKLHVEMFSGNLTPCVNRLSKLLHRGETLKIFNFNDDKVSAQHCRWQTFSPSAAVQNFMLKTFPTQSQSDLKEWGENLTGWHPSVSQY